MKKRFFWIPLLIIFLGVLAFWGWKKSQQPPYRQAFINGNILTMDADNTIVEAVVIEQDRILAAGSYDEVSQYIDGRTLVHDLEGATLMPGFIEAHGHFPGSGIYAVQVNLNSPPIGDVLSIEDGLAKLREQAANTPEGELVVGFGYDDTLMAEKRHYTREELDSVSTKHPVYVMHISGHFGVANSMMLEQLGITKETPNPEGGEIGHDPVTGELNGFLAENAHAIAREIVLDLKPLALLKVMRLSVDDYASHGVTTVQNGLTNRKQLQPLALAAKLGVIPMRVELWPDAYDALAMLEEGVDFAKFENDKVSVGAFKVIADGSIQGYTGYLSEPYFVPPADKDADYRGYATISSQELNDLVTKIYAQGRQVAIHTNGDAAIEQALDAIEIARQQYPLSNARPILIHAQMMREDQLDRAKELGVTPSFFSAHVYYWGDRHRDIFIGPERAMHISPAKTALDKGVPFTIHLDTPVVPIEPLLLAWSAVNRVTANADVLGPEEKISTMQALRAITIDAAWQTFQEANRGSIEPGKFADFVILSANPLIDPMALRDIEVMQTIVGGRTIYIREK